MREEGTHFEQVPKAVIEKILAQQNTRAENEAGENDAVAKSAANKAEDHEPISPKG
jgi:hypothetical protein